MSRRMKKAEILDQFKDVTDIDGWPPKEAANSSPHVGQGDIMFRTSRASDEENNSIREHLLAEEGHSSRRDSLLEHSNLEGDYGNVCILLFLYLLQGIPLGLAASMPLILQSRSISYTDQALFSFVYWPFSLKLLWAPIVDGAYSSRIGRRKSWLVPTQYMLAFCMYFLSFKVTTLLGDTGSGPNILLLTATFFILNFLAATQDIAVDGWALTMLSRRNVGYASTCNSVGQTAGYFLGNVVFLALESADFSNKYLRSVPATEGLVTLSGFLYFWSVVFAVTTTLVLLLKSEGAEGDGDDFSLQHGVIGTYKLLWSICKLPAVREFTMILLTYKIGFAAADAVTALKLVEAGVPKEDLALLAIPMVPLQIVLPWIISRYTAGPRPLDVLIRAYPWRLVMGLIFMVIVAWTPYVKDENGVFPTYYFLVLILMYGLHQIALYSMFVASMAYNAKISDPAIGGTYMTMLNTLNNLGGNWPNTLSLWLVEYLTWTECTTGYISTCVKSLDGYYVESVVCALIGVLWLIFKRRSLSRLQDLPARAWRVVI